MLLTMKSNYFCFTYQEQKWYLGKLKDNVVGVAVIAALGAVMANN
jgi:hypothetical protein